MGREKSLCVILNFCPPQKIYLSSKSVSTTTTTAFTVFLFPLSSVLSYDHHLPHSHTCQHHIPLWINLKKYFHYNSKLSHSTTGNGMKSMILYSSNSARERERDRTVQKEKLCGGVIGSSSCYSAACLPALSSTTIAILLSPNFYFSIVLIIFTLVKSLYSQQAPLYSSSSSSS